MNCIGNRKKENKGNVDELLKTFLRVALKGVIAEKNRCGILE